MNIPADIFSYATTGCAASILFCHLAVATYKEPAAKRVYKGPCAQGEGRASVQYQPTGPRVNGLRRVVASCPYACSCHL